jgi:hypothetical protein
MSSMRTFTKPVLWIAGSLAVVLIAGYFIAGTVIRKKVDAALAALPPSVQIRYGSLHSDLFNSQIDFSDVRARFTQDEDVYEATIDHITLEGIRFLELIRTKRLRLRHLQIGGIKAVEEKRHLLLEGNADLDSVYAEESGPKGFGEMHLMISRLHYRIPHADETVQVTGLELDTRNRSLRLDTLRVLPLLGQEEMGRVKDRQVDVWEVTSEGIEAVGLDIMGLRQHRLVAERIEVHRNRIHVFRDRRLPLEPGEKELPVASLRAMPVDLRVGELKIGVTTFSYKEYPKEGDEPGTLSIDRMTMEVKPLISHPVKGDPPFLTVWTEGSLMNSGTVRAKTEMPLHAGEPYRVTGAFHDLDVTSLNNPAERLGHLHLESGMLNQLNFHFEMSEDRSTGLVTGQYHELVVDKLKKNGKVDKFKSFALKHFIIPKTKEQASGKVNYKRDRERYFSYYLLHSLLVGVKSSFSLGFLLPG